MRRKTKVSHGGLGLLQTQTKITAMEGLVVLRQPPAPNLAPTKSLGFETSSRPCLLKYVALRHNAPTSWFDSPFANKHNTGSVYVSGHPSSSRASMKRWLKKMAGVGGGAGYRRISRLHCFFFLLFPPQDS